MKTSNGPAIAPGMRVRCRDAEWLVTRVDPSDQAGEHHAVHCVGADDLVCGHESIFLTQLDTIEPVDPRRTELVDDPSSGYRLSKLYLEAQLRQMPATGTEPDLAGLGAFRPMRFQLGAVRLALKQLRPRLLLADAVGLGKTIQVGMILTELLRRGRAGRILVLAKKSMLTQFQSELWNRFAIPLVRLDSQGIAKLRLRIPANKNPFEVYQRIIISIDTLKDVGSYRHFLESTRWDVVVIDEAHNVAGASVPERHLSHRLARLLSRRTDSMLLTTATPHNGKKETFGRLISLLDPSAIPDPDLREYDAEDIRGFFLMRFKEDVREDAGEQLTDRKLVPLASTTIDASREEEEVYSLLTELRTAARDARKSGQGRKSWANQAIVQYGLYKQFLSSPESCRRTAEKRLANRRGEDPGSPEIYYLEKLREHLRGLSLAHSSRYRLLRRQLDDIGWNGKKKSPRVLIFTEYRATQESLAETIARDYGLRYSNRYEDQPEQVLATIHGSCPDVHLMKTIEAFGTGSAPMRLLIATDVASEGINLHHECHDIIHFDLPWSIITLIQRNGRIDRYGQTESPVLRYLMVHTEEGLLEGDRAIFDRLIEKVEEINRSRRQGESVLRLYDPEAEERYIAEHGILTGDADVLEKAGGKQTEEAASLESLLSAASLDPDEMAAFLLGDGDDGASDASTEPSIAATARSGDAAPPSRLRLFSDREFLVEGYRHLAEENRDYLPLEVSGESDGLLVLTAPADLKRRLGAPDERGDVISGATAIPAESWPENGQFHLTSDPARVELAIRAARNLSGYWSRELLLTEQHPILRWITERLLMLMGRGTAPLIASRHLAPGELCFFFIGQICSNAGVPIVVDAHAISFLPGGRVEERPLREALEAARFDDLVNTGRQPRKEAAGKLVGAAVNASLARLKTLRDERDRTDLPALPREESRLRLWKDRRRELIESKIAQLGEAHPRARRLQKTLEEMEKYTEDRTRNWHDNLFPNAARERSTQLLVVIEGVEA